MPRRTPVPAHGLAPCCGIGPFYRHILRLGFPISQFAVVPCSTLPGDLTCSAVLGRRAQEALLDLREPCAAVVGAVGAGNGQECASLAVRLGGALDRVGCVVPTVLGGRALQARALAI